MLYVANNASQTLAVNDLVALGSPSIRTGCTATLSGTTAINLNRPGFYKVTFTAVASAAAANATINMLRNGSQIPGWTASAFSTAAGDNVNLVIDAIVQVGPNDTCNQALSAVALTFAAASAITVTNATVSVTKLA